MARRGRSTAEMVWGSDDDESYYEDLTVPAAPASRRSTSRLRVQIDDDRVRQPSPGRIDRRRAYHQHRSYQGIPQSAVDGPENIIIENHLNLPQQPRPRASSTGAPPQPNYLQPIYVQPSRSRSRERIVGGWYSESSDDGTYRSSSRHRRRKSSPRREEPLPTDVAIKLARLELMESEKERISPSTAEKLMRLKMYEENNRRDQYNPEISAKLERLRYREEREARDAEEAAITARLAEQSKADKQRREALYLEYQQKQQQQEAEEQEAIAKAEARRLKREAELKAERDRVIAAEREKADKEQIERERIIALERDRADKEKAERSRIIAEEKARAEREKKEAEEERRRIILEEEERRKKEKEEDEALRRRILAEEEAKEKERKAKEKEEEEAFQQRVKDRFMKHGYSPDYIEDILENKKALVRRTSTRRAENQLAIEGARPTYIRVQVKHLYPETLNEYDLPWEYDPADNRYLLIKEYITHELQQELFEHTKKIKIRREKLLITDGYVKETKTTIKPKDVYKDSQSDDMFIVRKKSVGKSPRRSWMFT